MPTDTLTALREEGHQERNQDCFLQLAGGHYFRHQPNHDCVRASAKVSRRDWLVEVEAKRLEVF